jgi:hypothetical protein
VKGEMKYISKLLTQASEGQEETGWGVFLKKHDAYDAMTQDFVFSLQKFREPPMSKAKSEG